MKKRKKYINKGNTELDPNINPGDRILYEFDDAQINIYKMIQKDLKEVFTKNILLGGARGCGKSSLVNLAADFEQNLVVKIDCSIVDEDTDLLILIANELKKILDSNKIPLGSKQSTEINRLMNEITFTTTNVYRLSVLDGIQENSESIADFLTEVGMSLKWINFKSNIQDRIKEALVSKKEKTEELLQQRITACFERKTAFGLLIDKINEASKKKLILIFDEIDKHNEEFLDKVFDKYKSFFTSGKSTNIFLCNISQYYYIKCGNAFDNIDVYFDKKYFLRAASFSLFKNILYNEICSPVALEISYFLSQGIFRNVYAEIEEGKSNVFLMLKAKYYIRLVEFVNNCEEFDDFIKEVLISIFNKILKSGLIANQINLNTLKQICSEEFSMFKNILLEKRTLYILKSHAANGENWIVLNGNKITVDFNEFKEEYKKELNPIVNNQNSSSYWKNPRKEIEGELNELSVINHRKLKDLNSGQIVLRNSAEFEFYLIEDSSESHNDIIKTLIFEKEIKAFITVKKKNSMGYEYGYIIFIDSSIKGRHVLYYDNASWLYEDLWVKRKIDNFILVNNIKEIEIEVDSNFKVNKDNLHFIICKFNKHKDIAKDWISVRW